MWSEEGGCTGCSETFITLPEGKETSWPTVVVAVIIPGPSPFLLEVLEAISSQDYPLSKMTLFLHNQVPSSYHTLATVHSVCVQAQHHEALVSAWYEVVSSEYSQSTYLSSSVAVSTEHGKRKAL